MLHLNNIDLASAKAILKESQHAFFAENENLNVHAYSNAIVRQGFAYAGVWHNEQRLPHTWLHRGFEHEPLVLNGHCDCANPPPSKENMIHEDVVFVGSFNACWGHEITDHLKHFWFYFNEHYQHLKHLKLIYTLIFDKKPTHNFFELLEYLGIHQKQLQCIEKPTQFKTIYVPDECFFYDLNLKCRRYTKEYIEILNKLPTFENQNTPKKIYFSRTQTNCWKDYNELELENFFKNQGFSIFYPEKLNFKEELTLLQNAEVFAATEGSIAHNVVFCKNLKNALILRKCAHFTQYQLTLNSLLPNQTNIVYINCGYSPFADRAPEWWIGPFFMYESNYLRRYFHLKPKFFPLFKFLKLHWKLLKEMPFKKRLSFLDHTFLGWSHPFRAQLKIGTRIKQFKNLFKK